MTRKQKRISVIAGGLAVLALAAGLVLFAMRDTIVFFYMPADIAEKAIGPGQRFRLGGIVEEKSWVKGAENTFKVTDQKMSIPVTYKGILPDLFREGQGIVAEGMLDASGTFVADTVLAKHDENYMPKEVADRLKEQGLWVEGGGQ
jgi:cytochrome c-type biogenesis protein CcmE